MRYSLSASNEKIIQIVYAAEKVFRKHFKTGSYLRKSRREEWAIPYVEAVLEAERQAEIEASRPKVTLDFSALEQIREDATTTRDSLLTDEEKAESEVQTVETAAPVVPESETKPEENVLSFEGLDALHLRILTALLKGQAVSEILRSEHRMASVVADSINEAFYEAIGDSILECDGDTIRIVDDYRDDVEAMLR